VANLGRDIGIPERLGEVGLREEHVEAVASEAIKSGNVVVNPRRTSVEDLKAILREAL
jgi:alcohol dehydrogenase